MRIILTQTEIEEAVEKLILEQVNVPDDMRIDIDLKATRGEEGYQAFVDIVAHDAPEDGTDRSVDPRVQPAEGAETLGIAEKVIEARQQAQMPRRRGRPAGARNKPKEIQEKSISAWIAGQAGGHDDQDPPSADATTRTVLDPQPDDEANAPGDESTNAFVEQVPDAAQTTQESVQKSQESVDAVEADQNVLADDEVPEKAPEETPGPPNVSEIPEIDQVEVDSVPEPEPSPEPEPEPAKPEASQEAPPRQTRSLFANLGRPAATTPGGAPNGRGG